MRTTERPEREGTKNAVFERVVREAHLRQFCPRASDEPVNPRYGLVDAHEALAHRDRRVDVVVFRLTELRPQDVRRKPLRDDARLREVVRPDRNMVLADVAGKVSRLTQQYGIGSRPPASVSARRS